MRYLVLPLFAVALSLSSVDSASAEPRWHKHRPKAGKPGIAEVPELDGKALPAALTLLAGATVVVMSRRRTNASALPQ
jgi:hypothetical protein